MASAKITEALKQATSSENPAAAIESILLDNLDTLRSSSTMEADMQAITEAVVESSTSLSHAASRALLGKIVDSLRRTKDSPHTVHVGQSLIDCYKDTPTSPAFQEHISALCDIVAGCHEANEDYDSAAKVLSVIPLDTSQRRVSDTEKASTWIRIVRNYLEVDNTTSAEMYLNKLKNVMHNIDDPELNLHFKLSAARIQDSKREFLAAAQSYHTISVSPAITEEERLHTLAMAIKCAILAPAGPPRSKVLNRLYKDERSVGLEEYGILEKIFLDRLLAPAEVEKFAEGLQEHQLAFTADGSTVLQKAVLEHNLLGASRLYSNIGFDALGSFLGLDGDRAEETTSRMIEQGRLAGRIDQINRIIWFEGSDASGEKGSGHAKVVVGKEMRRWDANVQALAEELEMVTNSLQAEFPEFVEQQLAKAA